MVTTATVQTGIQFTEQNPLLVMVGKVKDTWNIQVSSDAKFPPTGKLYSDMMQERLKAVPGGKDAMKVNWQQRGIKDGPAEPHFIADPDHHPVVMREGEYVRFQCDYPFVVWAHRDPNVMPNFDSPENPFGWTMSQQSTQQAPYVVIGVAQPTLTAQRFYKSIAWIIVDGQTILVDPDVVGL
jgi:hypothetical protein